MQQDGIDLLMISIKLTFLSSVELIQKGNPLSFFEILYTCRSILYELRVNTKILDLEKGLLYLYSYELYLKELCLILERI